MLIKDPIFRELRFSDIKRASELYKSEWEDQSRVPIARNDFWENLPSTCFVLYDNANTMYSLLLSVPVKADTTKDIAHLFPTYNSILDYVVAKNYPDSFDTVLCFSITTLPNARVMSNSQEISVTRYMLARIRGRFSSVFVYTRMAGVKGDPESYFYAYQNQPRELGPAGMHISFGALPDSAIILPHSRPEDIDSGGSNIVLEYGKK